MAGGFGAGAVTGYQYGFRIYRLFKGEQNVCFESIQSFTHFLTQERYRKILDVVSESLDGECHFFVSDFVDRI